MNPKVVSERLGHSSTRLTMDIYSHVLPGLQASAIAGLERALAPKVAMSHAVSKLLARLINKGPGKMPWTLSVPEVARLAGFEPTTSASAGQRWGVKNLLSWTMKSVAWLFRTIH